jgi:DNA-directed RNA polymerase specialized sigma24 family protein
MENPMADIETIKQIADPAERARRIGVILGKLPDAMSELRAMRQAAVLELRAQGWSHAQIGEALGIHRNRAAQIADGKPGGGKGGGTKATTE